MKEIKIESGIPMPKNSHRLTDTMRRLEVGQSFVWPGIKRHSIWPTANHCKIKVSIRTISDTEVRVWRVA